MVTFGTPRLHLSSATSTNDAARAWALIEDMAPPGWPQPNSPAPSGALVTADFQTQGRGQRGHQWAADAGQSALMSFVYRLPPNAEVSLLGLMTALAAAEALASFGVSPQIKWPNDVLIDGGKVGGILVEIAAGIAVLGIGINVNQAEFEGASEFAYPPTSLRQATRQQYSVNEVVEAVGHSLTYWEAVLRRDRGAIIDSVRSRLAKGAAVRQGTVSATLIGLTDSGAAVVRLPDGTFAEWATVN